MSPCTSPLFTSRTLVSDSTFTQVKCVCPRMDPTLLCFPPHTLALEKGAGLLQERLIPWPWSFPPAPLPLLFFIPNFSVFLHKGFISQLCKLVLGKLGFPILFPLLGAQQRTQKRPLLPKLGEHPSLLFFIQDLFGCWQELGEGVDTILLPGTQFSSLQHKV